MTDTNQLILEASQTDDRNGDVVDKLLARTLLETMPDDFIRYALYHEFRLGNKATKKTMTKLAKWRRSNTAQILYGLWRGCEYQPKPLAIPTKMPNLNSEVVRVFMPIVETIGIGEALADGIEFSNTTIPIWVNPFASKYDKPRPIGIDDKPAKQPTPASIDRAKQQRIVYGALMAKLETRY